MRNIIIGIVIALVTVFGYVKYNEYKEHKYDDSTSEYWKEVKEWTKTHPTGSLTEFDATHPNWQKGSK